MGAGRYRLARWDSPNQTNSYHCLWITGESCDDAGNESPRLLYAAADHVNEAVLYIEHLIIDCRHRPLQTWSIPSTSCSRYVSTVSRALLILLNHDAEHA